MSEGLEMLDFEFSLVDNDYYTTVDLWFSVAANLYLIDPSLVPVEWEYTPSIAGISLESYSELTILEMVEAGYVTADDLIVAGNAVANEAKNTKPEGE